MYTTHRDRLLKNIQKILSLLKNSNEHFSLLLFWDYFYVPIYFLHIFLYHNILKKTNFKNSPSSSVLHRCDVLLFVVVVLCCFWVTPFNISGNSIIFPDFWNSSKEISLSVCNLALSRWGLLFVNISYNFLPYIYVK